MEQVKIVGIKKTPSSKNSSVNYYTYYYQGEFTDYDKDHAVELSGKPYGSEFGSVDLGCQVGDIVEFFFSKGFQDKAQLAGCRIIKPASVTK